MMIIMAVALLLLRPHLVTLINTEQQCCVLLGPTFLIPDRQAAVYKIPLSQFVYVHRKLISNDVDADKVEEMSPYVCQFDR